MSAVAVGYSLTSELKASVSRDIWYVFITDAATAPSGILPIVFSVYWKKQTFQASFRSLVLSAVVGTIISIGGPGSTFGGPLQEAAVSRNCSDAV